MATLACPALCLLLASLSSTEKVDLIQAIRLDRDRLSGEWALREDGLWMQQGHRPKLLLPGRIPAGTYPNQTAPVDTVVVKAMLVGQASLDDRFVTDLLAALFANVPDLIAAHPRAAEISVDTAFRLEDGMSIPLHPAAERFWRGRSQ